MRIVVLGILSCTLAQSAGAAEVSTLERAYLKELAFLKAEKAELEKQASTEERESERVLSAARAEVDALSEKVLAFRRQNELTEERLREAPPAVREKLDPIYEGLARVREMDETAELPALPKDRAPTNEELAAAVAASFAEAVQQLELGAAIRQESGVFFGVDGNEISGRIVKVGSVAAYGVAESAAGVLVPAGQGQLRLLPVPAELAARALADGRPPHLMPIYLVDSFAKEVAATDPGALMKNDHGIVNTLMSLPIFEAEWVLYLLIILSIISVGVMVERAMFYRKHRIDIEVIRKRFKDLLLQGDFDGAADYLSQYDSLETNVALFGLREHQTGPDSVEDLLRGAEARERLRYNRWLSFLATVGSNSPFIGLFGTVLGIIRAFSDLSLDVGNAGGSVMAGISEALIATAVGLLVAIPAVIAYNAFMGRVKTVVANSELLSRTLLSALKAHEPAVR